MAKTSRSKKSKQDQISEDLKVRIIATVGLFLIVVGAMKLGPIGEQLNFTKIYWSSCNRIIHGGRSSFDFYVIFK